MAESSKLVTEELRPRNKCEPSSCSHYVRACSIVAPCCNKVYPCRFCHNDHESHEINRFNIKEIKCRKCDTVQPVSEHCVKCNIRFARYFCSICNLYDDAEKGQYHCSKCGICRIGGKKNFVHCDNCCMCVSLSLMETHKCNKKAALSNCLVCIEDIHSSRDPLHAPSCGHMIHLSCYRGMLSKGLYRCLLCRASLVNMAEHEEIVYTDKERRRLLLELRESKVPKSLNSSPPTPNSTAADEEIAQLLNKIEILSMKVHTLQQEKEEQIVLHDQIDEELQQVRREKEKLLMDEQQLKELVSQLQRKETRTDASWKVSSKEIKMTQQELGRGGWGVIWVGIFREQKVAVKQMHDSITSQVNLDLLHREINTMAHLRHPNLLQFIGAVFDHPSGNPMIITEIMDTSLRKAYEDKLLTPTRDCLPVCVGIMRDVAVGLNYLHCLPDPIIHRDVSSANVLLESKGKGKWKTKISDFGSANKAKEAMTRATGAIVYSAPESIQTVTITGVKPVKLSTKMDVFSYGVLVCEVLSCKFPDVGVFPQTLRLINRRCPLLYELICACVEEKPTDRLTIKQVIGTIDSWINDYSRN